MADTADSLRRWAKGMYPLEAGVELLVRAFGGRFARPGNPWIRPASSGGWFVDVAAMSEDDLGVYSGGERRLLLVAGSLLGGEPANLYEQIPGLDRDNTTLVLAAIAWAAGSHEHADIGIDHASGVARLNGRLPGLFPWPATDPV